MSAVRYALATSAYVATSAGPCLVGALRAGDELVMIQGDGSLGTTAIGAIEDLGAQPCVGVLTRSGHLVLSDATVITTSSGHRPMGEVLLEARAGRRPRLEIIPPEDLPRVPERGPAKKGAAAAFALFDGQVLLPWTVASLPGHERALAGVIKSLGEAVQRLEEEEWLVLRSERRLGDLPPGRPEQLAAEAGPLSVLMAWEEAGDSWTLRSPLASASRTMRALAALAAAGTGAAVMWQPGYFPVEARIEMGASARGHSEVVDARSTVAEFCAVGLEGMGSIVMGGALVDARM